MSRDVLPLFFAYELFCATYEQDKQFRELFVFAGVEYFYPKGVENLVTVTF